jgi:hypothetical protein
MSSIVNKQAQHIQNQDVVIYDRSVQTVEGNGYTNDGLVKLTLRKAGQYFCTTVEVSVDTLIETLEL